MLGKEGSNLHDPLGNPNKKKKKEDDCSTYDDKSSPMFLITIKKK